MIRTSKQLKDKVHNLAGSDTQKAQALIRTFVMERFLERISLSRYRNNFILKGGMLVAAVVGVDVRATMDIDTTVKSMPLTSRDAEKIIREIMEIDAGDCVGFRIKKVTEIMEEHDYPGIRFMIEADLDRLRQPFKIDISTGDVITPGAVEFSYQLMFEERSIPIWSYNVETLLAEKMETLITRDSSNTRMRDFYDIHILGKEELNYNTLKDAFNAVCEKRKSLGCLSAIGKVLEELENDAEIKALWDGYVRKNYYVAGLEFEDVMCSIKQVFSRCGLYHDASVHDREHDDDCRLAQDKVENIEVDGVHRQGNLLEKQAPGSGRKSVLAALREKQEKQRIREKQQAGKTPLHKKEEQSL